MSKLTGGLLLYVLSIAAQAQSLSVTVTGAITQQTLAASITPAAGDLGKTGHTFVGARISNGAIYLLGNGGWSLYDAGNPTTYASGPLQASSFNVVSNTDLSRLQGTEVFLGYGRGSNPAQSLSDMSNSGLLQRVHTIAASTFNLTSSAVVEGGTLPTDFTCDGSSATPPLAWSGAPANTQSYAVVMHHFPGPGDSHWYWVMYNLPAATTTLARNAGGVGTLGTNSVNGRTEYSPPCSKGPGSKLYTYTVYALSAAPTFSVPASQVTREVLLNAIADRTLGLATLNVVVTR